ncbi:hypothetical protein [Bacillus sp. 1P06AnD]|uniref:hypothetical protein n=1 Tax=Bacillus sp. 1P06AnD TaxID=3132208 RepID=UPI00399F79CA
MNELAISQLSEQLTDRLYQRFPELESRYGEEGRQKCVEDNKHHYRHLSTAFAMKDKAIFTQYSEWLNGILSARGMETVYLKENFRLMEKRFEDQHIDDTNGENLFYIKCLRESIEQLEILEHSL